jgi:acetyltransferase-like isoleucine patch superfamily enzyme
MIRRTGDRLLDIPFWARNGSSVTLGARSRVRYRSIRVSAGCRLDIGAQSLVLGNVNFERAGARMSVGSRTFVGRSDFAVASRVEIGDDVLIAWGCTIVDHDSHALRFADRKDDVTRWIDGQKDWSTVAIAPVSIHDKAWIGLRAIVLKGVTVGEGAIVGAGSVVSRDVAPWTIVAGNPARVIRELEPHER